MAETESDTDSDTVLLRRVANDVAKTKESPRMIPDINFSSKISLA